MNYHSPVNTDIPTSLHGFFVPQIEQLSLKPVRHLNGLSATISSCGYGGFWCTNIGDDCLYTSLDLTLLNNITMQNSLESYYCVGLMSADNVAMTPVQQKTGLQPENLISFRQDEGFYRYGLEQGSRYTSRSICFTERFLDKLSRKNPTEANLLREYLSSPTLNELPYQVTQLLYSINPNEADKASTAFKLNAVTNGVFACLLDSLSAERTALIQEGSVSSQRLVEEARTLINENLNRRLTLDTLAHDLNVSRSNLAAIFKKETGQGIGAYMKSARMQQAANLLRHHKLSIAEVGEAVGYPRLSSFSAAYKQYFGTTPSQSRQHLKYTRN